MAIREAKRDEAAEKLGKERAEKAELVLLDERDAGVMAFAPEPFDSEIFGLRIGRITHAESSSRDGHRRLLEALATRTADRGYRQILRRVPIGAFTETWALEGSGFELMDVGVTFARKMTSAVEAPRYDDLDVHPSSDADMERLVPIMVGMPWGSRYEADPAYSEEKIRDLRSRWLWNSHRGRAAVVLVGAIDSEPAGYVTCLLDRETRVGEIELVGTLAAFRGRRVASRIIEHAIAWFSTRAGLVTVRTQATNFAAANLYEKSGFTLHASDMTFRLALAGTGRTGS